MSDSWLMQLYASTCHWSGKHWNHYKLSENCACRFPFQSWVSMQKIVWFWASKEVDRNVVEPYRLQALSEITPNRVRQRWLESFRHRPYSDPKDTFKKVFNDTVDGSVLRQTLRDNGTTSRGVEGKVNARKSQSRRQIKKQETYLFGLLLYVQ